MSKKPQDMTKTSPKAWGISCVCSKRNVGSSRSFCGGQSKIRPCFTSFGGRTRVHDAPENDLRESRDYESLQPRLEASKSISGSQWLSMFHRLCFQVWEVGAFEMYIQGKHWGGGGAPGTHPWLRCFGTWERSWLYLCASKMAHKYKISSMIIESAFSMWMQN